MVKLYIILVFAFATINAMAQTEAQKIKIKKATDTKTVEALIQNETENIAAQKQLKNTTKNLDVFDTKISNQKRYLFNGFTTNNRPRFKNVLDTFAINTMWVNRLQLPYAGSGTVLTGQGFTLAQWDEGRVKKYHEKYTSERIKNFEPDTVVLGPHATLVASNAIADHSLTGTADMLKVRGAAPKANLHAFDFTNDFLKIAKTTLGTLGQGPYLISNHSYGESVGWIPFMGDWYWLGDTTQTSLEDEKFGWYSDLSAKLDTLAHANPYNLMFWAAGNSRLYSYSGPHKVWAETTMSWVNSTTPRAPLGLGKVSGDGYDCMLTQQSAKNIITIGSMETIQTAAGYVSPTGVILSGYSCAGPTDDGRIKPDVVAPGDAIRSACVNSNDTTATNFYSTTYGTSNASPHAAGGSLLMQQHYSNTHGANLMLAATLKALIIHTASELSTTGPDYRTGYGLINPKNAVDLISLDNSANRKIIENTLNNTNIVKYNIIADGSLPLKVTIAWNDIPGAQIPAANAFDNSTANLINDLDIVLKDNTGTVVMRPYILDPLNPANAATTGINNRDNVEQIFLLSPPVGGQYTLEVSHKNNLYNNAPQNYSLIFSGITGAILPLQILSFTGVGEVLQNKLQWNIENQTAGVKYHIEKANESSVFNQIGMVTGTGINNGIVNYSFIDANINKGITYYRLKITKPSGVIIYTNIVKIIRGNIDIVQIFPNPASNKIYINIPPASATNVHIRIFDAAGKLVYSKPASYTSGANIIEIPCKNFAKGSYIVDGKGSINFSKVILIKD